MYIPQPHEAVKGIQTWGEWDEQKKREKEMVASYAAAPMISVSSWADCDDDDEDFMMTEVPEVAVLPVWAVLPVAAVLMVVAMLPAVVLPLISMLPVVAVRAARACSSSVAARASNCRGGRSGGAGRWTCHTRGRS